MSDCNLYCLMWWQEVMVQPREWCRHSSSLPSTPLTSNTTPANVTSRGGQSGMYSGGSGPLMGATDCWPSFTSEVYSILFNVHISTHLLIFLGLETLSPGFRRTPAVGFLKVFSTCQEFCQELKSSAEEASAVNRKIYHSKKKKKTHTHNINTLKQWDLASLFDICHSNLAVFMLSGEQEVACLLANR